MKLCNRGWAPEKSIESMTSGFRMLGLSQMRRTVLVTVIKGWVFSSTRAGVLETLSGAPFPPWSLPFSRAWGMAVEGCAPRPKVRRLRGDFHVWRSQIILEK